MKGGREGKRMWERGGEEIRMREIERSNGRERKRVICTEKQN
jgi:hypothetical protein